MDLNLDDVSYFFSFCIKSWYIFLCVFPWFSMTNPLFFDTMIYCLFQVLTMGPKNVVKSNELIRLLSNINLNLNIRWYLWFHEFFGLNILEFSSPMCASNWVALKIELKQCRFSISKILSFVMITYQKCIRWSIINISNQLRKQ